MELTEEQIIEKVKEGQYKKKDTPTNIINHKGKWIQCTQEIY